MTSDATSHAREVSAGERFEFGKNWSRFLARLTPERIEEAERSLRDMLEVQELGGRSFLDVGSGSGVFSLAARRLGARVHSFDYDPSSVACTTELRRRYFPDDAAWTVERGSALDADFVRSLGAFDVVYSWGVLHHTGDMWRGLDLVAPAVAPGGKLFIALYNDQGATSRVWKAVKVAYNRAPAPLRPIIVSAAAVRLWGPSLARDLLGGRGLAKLTGYAKERGMSPWHDLVDWVGGLPFEVARPDDVLAFYRARGFVLSRLVTCGGGLGCNEFVFTRDAERAVERDAGAPASSR